MRISLSPTSDHFSKDESETRSLYYTRSGMWVRRGNADSGFRTYDPQDDYDIHVQEPQDAFWRSLDEAQREDMQEDCNE